MSTPARTRAIRPAPRRAGSLRALTLALALAATTLPVSAGAQATGFAPLRPDAAGALARPVDVVLDDVTVAQAVRTLAREAGVAFTWSAGLPDLERRVTVHAQGRSVAAVLVQTLAPTRLLALVGGQGQLVLVARAAPAPQPTGPGAVRGRLRERESGRPIAGARIDLLAAGPAGAMAGAAALTPPDPGSALEPSPGSSPRTPRIPARRTALSAADGSFAFDRLPPGEYALEVSGLGLATKRVGAVRPDAGAATSPALIDVERAPLELAAIVVAPGHFGLLAQDPAARATLTRDEVRSRPQLGEDLFRAINRLPGLSSADMAAPFQVRGGNADELYVTLDGMELYEPFHLKDIDAALSILDLQSVGGVELTTGGFTADVGNRLTGVLAIHSLDPETDRPHGTLAASITGFRGQSQGGFGGGRGGWLVSARRGYLDLAFKLTGFADSLSPSYHDVFAKAYYDLAPGQRLTLHALEARDALHYNNHTGGIESRYGSAYLWATWDASLAGGLQLRTLASAGRLTWNRQGEDVEPDRLVAGVDDGRAFRFLGLRHDASLPLGSRLLLRWGGEARALAATYDYASIAVRPVAVNGLLRSRVDSARAGLTPDGAQVGAYASARLRLGSRLVAESGLRLDHQGYTGESQLSPRVNLVLTPLARTTVRAAWGRYVQPQTIAGLQVADGARAFGSADKATQVVMGVEQGLATGTSVRVEAYRREMGPERPRWISLGPMSNIPFFAQLEEDRVTIAPSSGRAQGLELFLKHANPRWDWAVSYALASARDLIDGHEVPRPLEQRHTLYLDAAWHPPAGNWRLSWAWQLHSGWPEMPIDVRIDTLRSAAGITGFSVLRSYHLAGDARLPWYHRLDLRAMRYFRVGRGRLALYADIFNVFDSLNPAGYQQNVSFGPSGVTIARRYSRQIPRVPSVGLSWEF